ncbi:ATP-binding cassette sub-family C member 3-like [Acropora millepora]|uniref:ATP-binding cassette sub-family C member 3-like n=1 Tax=Acropora millepora TaxID=45264 RepID=UPI001CF1D508|nr:ATP-binding cassette sub-family C member 3-like [Acropora millepora]
MTEETLKVLKVVAVSVHDPHHVDESEHDDAALTAPDIASQLPVKTGDTFEVFGRDVNWWLYVKHLESEKKGYIPSTCVVPMKEDAANEEKEELVNNMEPSTDWAANLKMFPEVPEEEEGVDRAQCPEEKANIFSKLTFWWLNGLIFKGFKNPLVDGDLWALGKSNRSVTIVPKFMEKWAREEKRCAIGKHCPVEEQCQLEQVKLKEEENDVHADTEFLPKKDEKQKDEKKEKKASLLRAIVYLFGRQFLLGMVLKVINDIIQFAQPQLLNLLISYTRDRSNPDDKWKGYVYAIAMFLVAMTISLVIHQYFQIVFVLGMKIRTAIIGMVYAKALALNNRSRNESTAGEMVNLMAVDAQRLMDLTTYINVLWSSPLTIIIALYFLYDTMGPAVFAGVGVLVLLIPFNMVVSRIARKLQVKQMEAKDKRIKLVNEIFSGIKVLKLYAWEESFMSQVMKIRAKELHQLKNAAYLNASFAFTFTCAPFMVALATFAIFVLTGNELTANKAFVALSLFNILRYPITFLPNVIISLIQGKVSIDRLTHFLNLEELDPNNVEKTMPEHISSQAIHVEDGSFSWDKEEAPILQNINVNIQSGSLVAVVGAVGCGKTTLLSAFLGETEKIAGKVYVQGSVAYVPQQAWIQNATVRDNILFGKSLDPKRYCRTVNSCALRTDMDILPGGDMTEIGEKGINLSGGQKQRISLARAVYFDADIFLLDDPLSAVDSHVGKHIFDKVIGPRGKLRKKTRVFVTHGVAFLPQVDQIIVMQNGRISEVGTYNELLENEGAFSEFLKTFAADQHVEDDDPGTKQEPALPEIPETIEEVDFSPRSGSLEALWNSREGGLQAQECARGGSSEALECARGSSSQVHECPRGDSSQALGACKADSSVLRKRIERRLSVVTVETVDLDCQFIRPDHDDDEDKIIEVEKAETGRVRFAVFWAYAKSVKVYLAVALVLFIVLAEIASVFSGIWLASWSASNVTTSAERDRYLGGYAGLGVTQAFCVLMSSLSLALGSKIASRHLHKSILVNVMHLPMSFFESTPLGRIVNRFSKDISTIDDKVPMSLASFLRTFCTVVGTIIAISFATPMFLVVIIPLGALYFFIQRIYVATSRQLKRIESVSRSPIFNNFFETINGASTIRAFGQQDRLIQDNYHRVDENHVAYFPGVSANRWLALRLEFVGNLAILFAAIFAVIRRDSIDSGLVGLSITYALQVTASLNWMVRMSSELETNIVSVERVKEYAETTTEADWIVQDNRPPDDWPDQGSIVMSDFDLRYREGLPLVLKQINCDIKPGEKIGIVGRTGAGKSTLTLALFRILERAGGKILIDGIDISKLGLQDLRSRLTIIPQDPVLFSGTLRLNLDPFDSHTDEELWGILELSHLKNFVSGLEQGLLYPVTEEGGNLSVGQRQLVCLARALLRKSKVLVLDEATAAVDLETDELIQQTIRREFSDRTIFTIAHRLNTIMDYTRIMVLDKGFLVEFDTPENLLAQKGIFFSMAQDAGLA